VTSTADSKKRIVLPTARPGDVFDICRLDESRFMILRLERPEPADRPTREQAVKAISAAPLRMKMDWDALKKMTREP